MRPELVTRIAAREGHVGKVAEWVPSIGHPKDQQAVGGDLFAHGGVVPAIGGDGAVAVGMVFERLLQEPSRHGAEDVLDMRRQVHARGIGEKLADGGAEAAPPVLFGALGMDHLGLGEGVHRLLPDSGAGPVDLSVEAIEDVAPVNRASRGDSGPMRRLVGALHDLQHVMTGAEAQLFQRQFGRHGAGAPETRADNLECHTVPPYATPATLRWLSGWGSMAWNDRIP